MQYRVVLLFLFSLFLQDAKAESGSMGYRSAMMLGEAQRAKPTRQQYCNYVMTCKNPTFDLRAWRETYRIVGHDCVQEQANKGCNRLLQEQPDLGPRMRDCSPVGICMQEDTVTRFAQAIKGCYWNAPEAFDRDLGNLVISIPGAVSSAASSAANQYRQCYGRPQNIFSSVMNTLVCQSPVYWGYKAGTYVGQNYNKMYNDGIKWLTDQGIKFDCFSVEAKTQMVCYGILSVIAPLKVSEVKNTPAWLRKMFGKKEPRRPAPSETPRPAPRTNPQDFGRKAPAPAPRHPLRVQLETQGALGAGARGTARVAGSNVALEAAAGATETAGSSMSTSQLRKLIIAGKETPQALKQRLLRFDPTTDADRIDMMKFVNTSAQRGTKIIDIENSLMKDLNSVLDQDLVTALTNHHKLLIQDKFNTLLAKYKDQLDFKQYSDFKSQRYALIPKNSAWKAAGIPDNVIQEFEQAFNQANKELADKVHAMGLDREIAAKAQGQGSNVDFDPKKWFRAGIDSNADDASWNSRLSRELPDREGFARSDQPDVQAARVATFNQIQRANQAVVNGLGTNSPLLQSLNGVQTLRADVFDLMKKAKYDPAEIRKSLQFYYPGTPISDQAIQDLIQTAKLTDRVQPSIWQSTRTVSSVGEAKNGALLIDVTGMGANNAEQALMQSVQCATPSQLSLCTRLGERQVTRAFQEKMAKIRDISLEHCRQVGLRCSVTISGDDVRIIPENGPLPQGFARENLNRINSGIGPAQIRQAQLAANVPEAARVVIGQDGEAIEKYLREKLRRSGLAERSKGMTFNISMRTTKVDAGAVRIEMSGAGANALTAAERAELISLQRQAITEFNGTKPGRNYQFTP